MSSISAWHKKQHKKQVLKNKTARIAARDERVVETKTLSEIDAAIKGVMRHSKDEATLPHALKTKLDRLRKERKLVVQQQEAQRASQAATATSKPITTDKDTFQPLARPQVSIYYDAVMNPYGEPPPGQPRLYHRRGGGVTRLLDEACLPEEMHLPPPPPPPPPPRAQNNQSSQTTESLTAKDEKRRDDRPSRPRPEPPAARPKPTPAAPTAKANDKPSKDTATSNNPLPISSKYLQDPTQLPQLPQASASVRRRGLAHDIWASSDEVEYEATVGSFVGLDGSAAVERVDYYYQDASNAVQGPFPLAQLQQWVAAGYFTAATMIRTSQQPKWMPLTKDPELAKFLLKTEATREADQTKDDAEDDSVQTRIARLNGGLTNDKDDVASDAENSVQARIARLKGMSATVNETPTEEDVEPAAHEEDENDDDHDHDSIQARISRLKGGPTHDNEDDQCDAENSVQARIARLKGLLATVDKASAHEAQVSSQIPDSPVPDSVAARIAALKQQEADLSDNEERFEHIDGIGSHASEDERPERPDQLKEGPQDADVHDVLADDVVVASYLSVSADEGFSYAYPVDNDDEEPPAYPVAYDDDDVPPYPVDDVEYPVTDDYPATDVYPVSDPYPVSEPFDEAYPVVEPYPVAEESPAVEEAQLEPPKKKIKVEKDVVAFLPTHLRKRKTK